MLLTSDADVVEVNESLGTCSISWSKLRYTDFLFSVI